jgi:hypothetical protein
LFASLAGAADAEPPRGEAPAALVGDWYVLVHYRDPQAGEGAPLRWDDQIWRIEAEGSGLRWTLFPHPEFQDGAGRWERLSGGEEARSLGGWKPNPDQLREIAAGLDYGLDDERSKRLRATEAGGWASPGQLRATSASGVGYHERWGIERGAPGPVFSQQATLGSGRASQLEAGTRFVTREVLAGGDERRGEYTRADERRGVFRMLRMGQGRGGRAGR